MCTHEPALAAGRRSRVIVKVEQEMTRKARPGTGTQASSATDRVVARPDGFYWVADDGEQEFGPYPTAAQALAAASEAIETTVEEEQALQDAEAEIGVAERQDHDMVEVDEQVPPAGERS
jgi:hypothetical protein